MLMQQAQDQIRTGLLVNYRMVLVLPGIFTGKCLLLLQWLNRTVISFRMYCRIVPSWIFQHGGWRVTGVGSLGGALQFVCGTRDIPL
jgi:hypothetical protein